MAKGVTIEVKGLDKLQKQLTGLPSKLKKEVGAEIGFAAEEMAALAKADAPADQSFLRQEISVKKIDELNYEDVSGADYSGYLEFGTRTQVHIPAGLEDEAQAAKSAKGATSGSVRKAIFEWCRRKGIEESAWFPIYLSIMIKGIKPHPFFFKQLERVRPKLIKNIENILDDLAA
jgi:hypothetical protein